MPATPADLIAFLDTLAIRVTTLTHPPLYTVAESQALRGQIPGAHTKNLFLKDKKGRLFLVVAAEDATVDLKRLHEVVGAAGRFSFGDAARLAAALGVEPGSVTPFGAINDISGAVTVVLDQGLMEAALLNFHPLVNTMTTTIGREDFLSFLRATGHEPLVRPVAAATAARADSETAAATENCHSGPSTPS